MVAEPTRLQKRKCARTGCTARVPVAATGRPREWCSNACAAWAYRRRRRKSVHFRSDTDNWFTPQWLFDELNAKYGPFTLDPCCSAENAKCERFFTVADDGLAQVWTGRVFMNPPYGEVIGLWMAKAASSVREGTADVVVCLVPARTDTVWWHAAQAAIEEFGGETDYRKGRVKFGGSKNCAPFPSAVVAFYDASRVIERVAVA